MQIVTNEDGTLVAEQADLMNAKAANLLKETLKTLSEIDTETLRNSDKDGSNSILNDVAKQIFNKISEEDIIRAFHEPLGETLVSIIQTVFYKVKQLEDGVEHGLVEQAMGIQLGEYDNLTLKEMVAKISEGQQ